VCLRKQRGWWQRCGKIDVGLGKCKCESGHEAGTKRGRTEAYAGKKRRGHKNTYGRKGGSDEGRKSGGWREVGREGGRWRERGIEMVTKRGD